MSLWASADKIEEYLKLRIGEFICPGLMVSVTTNGVGFKWSTAQEAYSFGKYIYFEGHEIEEFSFEFLVTSDSEWREHARVMAAIGEKITEAWTASNGFLTRCNTFSVVIKQFGDVIPDTSGSAGVCGRYKVSMLKAYDRRWRPKKEDKKQQKPIDVAQHTARAVTPKKGEGAAYDAARAARTGVPK